MTPVFVYLAKGGDPETNMRVDLGLSEAEYALVTGTAFTLTNALSGLVSGYLADRLNRKWLLFATTVAYTAMTLACSLTHSFGQVIGPRMAFAMLMSACIPASVSLINDYFTHETRGRANSLFAFGVYLGGGLSSLTLLVNQAVG